MDGMGLNIIKHNSIGKKTKESNYIFYNPYIFNIP